MTEPVTEVGPVAVGGVGGSGTRVVAELLSAAGRHLGEDLNGAGDNLWFTLLFKHRGVTAVGDAGLTSLVDAFADRTALGRPPPPGTASMVSALAQRACDQHDGAWLAARRDSFLRPGPGAAGAPWGWKEPNTHVLLPRLWVLLPGLRYVHVVRRPDRMAVSRNRNQLRLWGPAFGVEDDGTALAALRFWSVVQRRALREAAGHPGRFLFLRHDDLCDRPLEQAERLFRFCGVPDAAAAAARWAHLVLADAAAAPSGGPPSLPAGELAAAEELWRRCGDRSGETAGPAPPVLEGPSAG